MQFKQNLNFHYRISDLQFNVTPPTVTTTSAPDDDYSASELSLIIDKADSIEEKDESAEMESAPTPKKMFSCDEAVIEEDPLASSESDDAKERKLSVIAIESKKSVDSEDVQVKPSKPLEASIPPPTSTSTQTVPTEEFPEASVTSTTINQTVDVGEIAQLNVETQQDTNIAHEIDTKEMRKSCSRSIKDDSSAGGAAAADEAVKGEEQQQKLSYLSHQQSTSQEEDYEVAMVSGLLPGCVAPAPTPAPSIAPLAETEADTAEDDPDNAAEFESIEQRPDNERRKRRKEKREKEGESQGQAAAEAESSTNPEKSKRNAVCPWEDE